MGERRCGTCARGDRHDGHRSQPLRAEPRLRSHLVQYKRKNDVIHVWVSDQLTQHLKWIFCSVA